MTAPHSCSFAVVRDPKVLRRVGPEDRWGGPRAVALLIVCALFVVIGCSGDPAQRRERYFRSGRQYFDSLKYDEASIEFRNAVKADPRFADGYYYLGLAERRQNRIQPAAAALQKCLDLSPDRADAKLELAEIYLIANDPAHALQLSEEVLASDPRNVVALLVRGKAYLGKKDYQHAKEDFEAARAIQPNDAGITLALAIAEIGLSNADKAEALFRRAIELNPASVEADRNLANLYLGTGRLREAEATLQQAIARTGANTDSQFNLADFYYRVGRIDVAASTLTAAQQAQHDSAAIRSLVGDFWVGHGEVARAVPEYEAAFAGEPSDLVTKKIVNAQITLGNVAEAERWNQRLLANPANARDARQFQGAIAYLRGDQQGAISELQGVLRDDPDSVFARYYLGAAFLASGETERARQEFMGCLQRAPGFIEAQLKLGEISVAKRDGEAAANYATQVIQANPRLLLGYLLATDAALLQGRVVYAERSLSIAARMQPDSPGVIQRRAELYKARKDYSAAEREYRRLLAIAPKPEAVIRAIVQLNLERNQVERAITILTSYAGTAGNSDLQVLLAQVQLQKGDLGSAVAACQKALQLNANNSRAYLSLGQAYERLADTPQAEQAYRSAERVNSRELAAYVLLGDLYERQGNAAQAKEQYSAALKLEPELPRAQSGMANAMVDRGDDPNVALGLAMRARQNAPADPHAAEALAWVYYKKGMGRSAIPLLQECVEKDRQNARFRYRLGLAYLQVGNTVQARQSLEQALKLGLPAAETDKARQSLASLRSPQS